MQTDRRKKLITVIACMLVQVCVGILYLWSIFNKAVVDYYSWSPSSARLVSSIMLLGFVVGNLAGGFLQDKTNPRLIATVGAAMFSLGVFLTSLLTPSSINLIFLTYCVIGGLGCGFTYASILSCLQKWFPARRGFASGLAVASFAASTVIFAPVSQWLLTLSAFGDKSVPRTFLTLSIVFFVLSMIACLFISLPSKAGDPQQKKLSAATGAVNSSDNKDPDTANQTQSGRTQDANTLVNPQHKKNYTPLQAMRTLPFWCIFFTLFFINGTWNIVVTMIKELGIERGLNEAAAVAAVTVTGVANTLGRFGMAAISDKIGRAVTVILLALVTMISAVVLIFADGYFYFVIIAILAFCYGGPSSTLPAMTTDLYGTKYGGTNYGFAMLGLGVSGIVVNLISIKLNNLTYSFIMGACTALIAAVLMFVCIMLDKKRKCQTTAGQK